MVHYSAVLLPIEFKYLIVENILHKLLLYFEWLFDLIVLFLNLVSHKVVW